MATLFETCMLQDDRPVQLDSTGAVHGRALWPGAGCVESWDTLVLSVGAEGIATPSVERSNEWGPWDSRVVNCAISPGSVCVGLRRRGDSHPLNRVAMARSDVFARRHARFLPFR